MFWTLIGLAVAVALFVIVIFNRLVAKRQMAHEGWSGIEVQLKRRANLIPNLIESVKGYIGHERDTLEAVTAMRAKADAVPEGHVADRAAAESLFGQALGRLLAVAESYPELKASQNFVDFQEALEDTENQIEMARRYYNGTVRELNTLVEQFPSNLVASGFGFRHADYFETELPEDRAVPQVSFDG